MNGPERLYQTRGEIIDAVNQLFDRVFISGSAEYRDQLYAPQRNTPMLAQSILNAAHITDFGWRFRTILQVMMRRTPVLLREFAGFVFDSAVQNYLQGATAFQGAITIDSLVAKSKQPPSDE